MSARDEPAYMLAARHDARNGHSTSPGIVRELLTRIDRDAAAVKASQPRTITTAEELDALPVGSVVLHHGRAFQHYPAHSAPFDEYQKWKCGDGGFVRSTKSGDMILPATVIHEATA